MFLCNSARPATRQHILEGFWFSDAGERISNHGFDQLEDAKRLLSGLYLSSDADPAETRYEMPLLGQRCGPRPISRRSFSSGSGLPFRPTARLNAVSNRWAFFGDRSKWAVSIKPMSSSAGTMATVFSPSAANNDDLTIIRHAVQDGRETLAQSWYKLSLSSNPIQALYRVPVRRATNILESVSMSMLPEASVWNACSLSCVSISILCWISPLAPRARAWS